jgi:hypothetical protein
MDLCDPDERIINAESGLRLTGGNIRLTSGIGIGTEYGAVDRWRSKFSIRFKPHRRKIRFDTRVIPRNRIAKTREFV